MCGQNQEGPDVYLCRVWTSLSASDPFTRLAEPDEPVLAWLLGTQLPLELWLIRPQITVSVSAVARQENS
jgi:hypothetical protein